MLLAVWKGIGCTKVKYLLVSLLQCHFSSVFLLSKIIKKIYDLFSLAILLNNIVPLQQLVHYIAKHQPKNKASQATFLFKKLSSGSTIDCRATHVATLYCLWGVDWKGINQGYFGGRIYEFWHNYGLNKYTTCSMSSISSNHETILSNYNTIAAFELIVFSNCIIFFIMD